MIKTRDENGLLSIGGLSTASGLSVETLRNWERRYGFPTPVRRKSGHRRYPLELLARLRLIRQVIELGYKPSFAVVAEVSELEEILRRADEDARGSVDLKAGWTRKADLSRWLDCVDRLDAVNFEVGLRRAWSRYGAFQFITGIAVPFFREVGERWADGRYTVAQEHFASEAVQSFLAAQWRPLSRQASGSRVVLANLEGELHSLGLHMAAVFLALNQIEVVFLGANTPRSDIITTAKEPRVIAVVIGLSQASDVQKSLSELEHLRALLPSKSIVAVGGNESLPLLGGVFKINSFDEFADWVRDLAAGRIVRPAGMI